MDNAVIPHREDKLTLFDKLNKEDQVNSLRSLLDKTYEFIKLIGWLGFENVSNRYEAIEKIVSRFKIPGVESEHIEKLCKNLTDNDFGYIGYVGHELLYDPEKSGVTGLFLSALHNVYAPRGGKTTLDLGHLKIFGKIGNLKHGIVEIYAEDAFLHDVGCYIDGGKLINNGKIVHGSIESFGEYLKSGELIQNGDVSINSLVQNMEVGRAIINGSVECKNVFCFMRGGYAEINGNIIKGNIAQFIDGGVLHINGNVIEATIGDGRYGGEIHINGDLSRVRIGDPGPDSNCKIYHKGKLICPTVSK